MPQATGGSVSNRHLSNIGWAAYTTTNYYHEDHLGTSRLITSFWGWPTWQGTFLPYGQEWNPQITTNHYKFTGKERDSEDNLDYFGARYYSSTMGRWMSPDWADKPEAVPYADLSDPQSLNLYGYVRNNPMNKADADGHCDVGCVWNVLSTLQDATNTFVGSLIDQGRALATDPKAASVTALNMFAMANTPVPNELSEAEPLRGAEPSPTEVSLPAPSSSMGGADAAPSQVQINKAVGDAYRDEVAAGLKAAGKEVQTEVTKQTPFGRRVVDIEVKQGGKLQGGVETKTGNSPYKPSQRAKDAYLKRKGYTVNVVRKPKDPESK